MLHHGTSWLFGPTWAVFVAASLVLAITPGPGVIYLVTRTMSQGRAVGLASIGGIALGNLGNAAFAAAGLAMVFAVSAQSFLLVKLAGAAYLVFLGIKALRPACIAQRDRRLTPGPHARAFRDAFLVALLNPKTALFFAAFLPQFVDAIAAVDEDAVAHDTEREQRERCRNDFEHSVQPQPIHGRVEPVPQRRESAGIAAVDAAALKRGA
jgi:threonine/homoserine/homoserine lactone efflux protein